MEFIWRCKHCRVENHLSGLAGMLLNCSCDRCSKDWEFMVVSEGGTLPTFVWIDANSLYDTSSA